MPEKPELDAAKHLEAELPKAPLSWSYLGRLVTTTGIFEYNDPDNPQVFSEIRQYHRWLGRQFIISGVASRAIEERMSPLHLDDSLGQLLFSKDNRTDYHEMMRTFERDHLGIELNNGEPHYWQSSAGGAGAGYPTEALANLFGRTSDELLQMLHDERQNRSWVILKSDQYLIPVSVSRLQPDSESLFVSGVMELTPSGEAFLNSILAAYEQGLHDGSNTKTE